MKIKQAVISKIEQPYSHVKCWQSYKKKNDSVTDVEKSNRRKLRRNYENQTYLVSNEEMRLFF